MLQSKPFVSSIFCLEKELHHQNFNFSDRLNTSFSSRHSIKKLLKSNEFNLHCPRKDKFLRLFDRCLNVFIRFCRAFFICEEFVKTPKLENPCQEICVQSFRKMIQINHFNIHQGIFYFIFIAKRSSNDKPVKEVPVFLFVDFFQALDIGMNTTDEVNSLNIFTRNIGHILVWPKLLSLRDIKLKGKKRAWNQLKL